MSTTALIVELMIIGIQVAVWVSMIAMLISGHRALDVDVVEKIATPLAVVLLAACYTVGVIFDAFTARVEDAFLRRTDLSEEDHARRRMLGQKLRLKDSALYAQLDNDEYLLRLLRSTTLNLFLIATFGALLMGRMYQSGELDLTEWLLYTLLLGVFAFMGAYGWWQRRVRYTRHRDAFYAALEGSDKVR